MWCYDPIMMYNYWQNYPSEKGGIDVTKVHITSLFLLHPISPCVFYKKKYRKDDHILKSLISKYENIIKSEMNVLLTPSNDTRVHYLLLRASNYRRPRALQELPRDEFSQNRMSGKMRCSDRKVFHCGKTCFE